MALGNLGIGLGQALQSGVKTYGSLQQMQLQKEQASRQQEMQQAQLQQMAIQRKLATQQVAMGDISTDTMKSHYVDQHLANIAQLPEAQRPGAYQSTLNHLNDMKVDTSSMSPTWDDKIASRANIALQSTPRAAEQRKFNQEQTMQMLKGRQALEVATLKTKGIVTPIEKSFGEAEGKADSAHFTEVQTAANSASSIKQDVDQLMPISGQIPNSLGFVAGNAVRLTDAGQQLWATNRKMVLDLARTDLKGAGRATVMMLKMVQDAKPSEHMALVAYQNMLKVYGAVSTRAISRNEMITYLKNNIGLHDRNTLQNIWMKYNEKYSLINKKTGQVQENNLNKWQEFLTKNPGIVGSKYKAVLHAAILNKKREIQQQQGQQGQGDGIVPQGFRFPGQQPQAQPNTPNLWGGG
jgi:hypothetical protein